MKKKKVTKYIFSNAIVERAQLMGHRNYFRYYKCILILSLVPL